MKKIVLGIFLVLLFVAGLAFFYLTAIDWNEHKDKIAAQFYNVTGKEIVFDGRLSFRLFPTPYLSATNTKIYNSNKRDEKPLVEVKNLVAELSLSSLLKNEFNVIRMILDGAVINIDWDNEGLNWQADLSPDQRLAMEDSKMVLNSVSLKNAEVNLEASKSQKKWTLTNLNGEISAQSIFGPFRIEGNYLNGGATEGFAITVGKLSESFATTLNGVISHPQSGSYIRFDGSFQLNNKVLNGNVIVESQKLSDFVNANNEKIKLSPEYNLPVALGFDVALSEQNLAVSNLVVKYGDTQGAGNLQVPLDSEGRPEVAMDFNFSELDLGPAVKFAQDFFNKYKQELYRPDLDFDFTVDLKAVRASYEGQNFKNLQTDFSFDEDTFILSSFNIILPGDTQFQAKGNIYPVDEELYYQSEISANTSDLIRTLQWLKIDPKASAVSTYKKMSGTAKVAGNFEKVQISPYKLTLDKSTFSGEAGIVFGQRNDIMLIVKTDTINLDNYISQLPEEEKKKSWTERIKYRFGKLDVLNSFDMVLDAKADLVIYEDMPFEKIDFKGNILKGVLEVEDCKINQVANAIVSLKGKIGGFGGSPRMGMLQYQLKTNDVSSLINKLELQLPEIDYKKFNTLAMNGVINGSTENFGINTSCDLGELSSSYEGKIFQDNGNTEYKGHLELKYPEFSQLLTNLKIAYEPAGQSLGPLQAKVDVDGNSSKFSLDNLDANIGYTNIVGNLAYDFEKGGCPNIITQLKINKFEVDKFLPKKSETSVFSAKGDDKVSFLAKPLWNKDKIDYSPYIYNDIKGNFDIAELSYKNNIFRNAKFGLELAQGIADIKDFKADYNNTPVEGALSLHMTEQPTIQVQGSIGKANVDDFVLGGMIYNLKGGTFSTRFDINSAADSEYSFISSLKGKAEFEALDTQVSGIDVQRIYNDLLQRENSTGLMDFVRENIGAGKTSVSKIKGRLLFDDQEYSLTDAEIQAPNTSIKIYGEGSFLDWTTNTTFNIRHEEPQILPEYSFSLKNGMDNPTVDINVSSLFSLYQSREKQQAETRAAEAEAERRYWDGQIKEQQKTANDLVDSARSRLEQGINEKISDAFNSEIADKYQSIKQEINQILAEVVDVTGGVSAEGADDNLIEKLKEANKHALSEIEELEKKVQEIYLEDMKKKNEMLYNKIVDSHNNLKKSIFSYNTQIDKYNERLANIVTDYKLSEDKEFLQDKKKIDSKIKELELLNSQTESARRFKVEDATVETYEAYNKELENVYQTLHSGNTELLEASKKLEEDTMPKVLEAERAYNLARENEENERRIRENTGTISVKKTGQTLKVVRNIEEIKTAEEEISKEGVQVLDFSKKAIKETSSSPEKSTENIIKKARTTY